MVTSSRKRDDARGPEEENSAKSSIHPPTTIFAGYARLPTNASMFYMSRGPAVEVNPYHMRIVDAACNCIAALGQKFLTNLLVGRVLKDGMEESVGEIRKRYISEMQRAIIVALEDVPRRYEEFLEGRGRETGSSDGFWKRLRCPLTVEPTRAVRGQ